jgi:mannose-6-phosphate isomerase
VEVTNLNHQPGEGLSKVTLEDGRTVTLKEIVASNPEAFLGREQSAACNHDVGVQARIGDSAMRLIVQVHPDGARARKYLNTPNGKTEAWIIAQCRELKNDRPHVFAGFKPGMTRPKWEDLFYRQDIAGMLEAMHKVYVQPGDVYVIEAGMPHAVGPGSLFLEIHEPNDYTLRMERNFRPDRPLTDEEIHYGIGFDALFDCFDYETFSYQELVGRIHKKARLLRRTETAEEYALITYADTPLFAANKIIMTGLYTPQPYRGHRMGVVLKGSGAVIFEGGRKIVRQGQSFFLPAGISGFKFESDRDGMEVVVGYPPALAG